LVFLLLRPAALAWNSAGHITIAAEAYRQLSPDLRGKVTEILKSHPDYQKWEARFNRDNAGLDLATFVFMRASTWPDEIRRRHNPFDHPEWHYVDYPLKPPSFPMEPGPAPDNDALYGIAQSERLLADSITSPELRAVYLSWLLHLIGDLHQPLHCASLVDDKYPHGDKGGNDFYVRPASRGIRLHSLWDGLLGRSGTPRSRMNYAIRIEAEYPRSALPELARNKTPKAWSLESRQLAVQKAYLNGKLEGSTSAETAPALPEGYTESAKAVAERQAALAGYRLADEIRDFVR
jgi:S1/P1 Nuclease